jgi:hypothetical protein
LDWDVIKFQRRNKSVNSVYLDLVFQIIKRKRNRPISFICVPYLGNRFVIACLSWWENYGGRWE